MLETFAVNICVKTKDGDFYKEVAINKSPIIIFGRRSDLENTLKSKEVIEWFKHNFRNKELYNTATYEVVHCKRSNECCKFSLNCKELTPVDFN